VAAGWVLARFARPPRLALIALELAVTLALTLVYIRVALASMTGAVAGYAPVFAMFGLMLLLSVRAALVPSPVGRTAGVGIAVMATFFVLGRDAIGAVDPLVRDGLNFISAAFVLATAVTSHVIYGLRRAVRRALQLGQYTLEDKLGEGGMGEVYRARHAMLRRDAAIKLIRPELAGEGDERERALQRFEREALATATLRSPHTIELYDFGVSEEGNFYYVMELLDGIDLDTVVREHGPLPPGRVAHLVRQICESLQEAHVAGMVHRDVKPANILTCRYGLHHDFVKVLDFGLVGIGQESGSGPGVAGTPAYLAPETVSRGATVDARADLYSLGCVAYWLLTGGIPFARDTAKAMILAHLHDDPEPPSRRGEVGIPESLETLVLECLAKDPDARPSSAAAIARRLEEHVAWDEDRARQWWDLHRPEGRRTPRSPAPTRTLTIPTRE